MFEVIPFLNEGEGLSGERVRAEPAAWNRKLVLRFTEDLKSAIGCVDAVAGYVMHSMGQKVRPRSSVAEERCDARCTDLRQAMDGRRETASRWLCRCRLSHDGDQAV